MNKGRKLFLLSCLALSLISFTYYKLAYATVIGQSIPRNEVEQIIVYKGLDVYTIEDTTSIMRILEIDLRDKKLANGSIAGSIHSYPLVLKVVYIIPSGNQSWRVYDTPNGLVAYSDEQFWTIDFAEIEQQLQPFLVN